MTASTKTEGFPPQIKYIVGNEVCERFSFYGMRAILTVFMADHLLMPKHEATMVYHLFVSACYFTPLLGAYISDRYWGKYKTIMTLSIVYCLGHAVLAMFSGTTALYWGLGLIALGSGGIKPCVSTHVGDQFTDKNKHLIQKIYDVFYFAINFGSFFSTLLIPVILVRYGHEWAFGIPGILMAVATVVFWRGHPQYVNVPPTGKTGKHGFLPILWAAIVGKRKPGGDFFSAAQSKYSADEIEAGRAVMDVCKVFATISVFWALFDQHGSSWVLQAQQMNLNVLGVHFEASQISALNPIMVMCLIPIFAKWVYPTIESSFKFPMTPLRRMSGGMVVAASSFVGAALIQHAIDAGGQPSVAWQFIPYLLITIAEIMISITGLEFAYTQAPRSMKSTIMSFFFLTIFAGNLLTAYVSEINKFQGAAFFWFFAALMAGVSGIFIWTAARYKVREYIEDGSAPVGH
ncbi:MAG: MFS transporter [Elusimicrobia bacterium CG11_big_fil_rev_8_21_14_0_20_64_6]|nr:MAG: MFS transporter [Elusimicrobia bacterium CG11_big_fil_rev_8_21_14_0_20_64_6]